MKLQDCHTVFLKCNEFHSHAALKAVFIQSELSAFANNLPEGNSEAERVDALIGYLANKRLADGRLIISVFIESLQQKYNPIDKLFAELGELIDQNFEQSGKILNLNIVSIAMNAQEAQEFNSDDVIKHPNLSENARHQLQELKNACAQRGIDWLTHYKPERDNWTPFTEELTSIHDIVWDIATKANQKRCEIKASPILKPNFLSDDFFSKNVQTRSKVWNTLRDNGGVLLIDSLSLYHPILRVIFSKYNASSFREVATLIIYPERITLLPVNNIIEQDIQNEMEQEFVRYAQELDPFYEIGVGSFYSLQRHLLGILIKSADLLQGQHPKTDNIERVRQLMGLPAGVKQQIFGQGVNQ
jgi:hypothetical protein